MHFHTPLVVESALAMAVTAAVAVRLAASPSMVHSCRWAGGQVVQAVVVWLLQVAAAGLPSWLVEEGVEQAVCGVRLLR